MRANLMNAYQKRPLKYSWTPVLYLTAVLLAGWLNMILPAEIFGQARALPLVAGIAIMLAAIAIGIWALKALLESGTTTRATRPASHLVTSGPFRFSRNPIYLGYTLVTLSLGLISGNGWYLAAALLTAVLTHAWVIRREERHLLARFGFEFERYCRRTRAWI